MAATPPKTGYAPVNGLELYYEIHGTGEPLILRPGGFGLPEMFGELLPRLAEGRQVIVVDLQAHGRTGDIDRPLSLEQIGDDVAALIEHLGFARADVMGYSMGGDAALRAAIQHPALVRKLVLVSIPFKRDGWYPEVRAGMDQISAAAIEFIRESPMYKSYVNVAPDPEHFPVLLDKMGDLMRQPYDWTSEVAALETPTMLVYGDADSVPPAHAVEFFGLLGGGKKDTGWDGAGMSNARLAILPGTTHYNSFFSPMLAPPSHRSSTRQCRRPGDERRHCHARESHRFAKQ